MSKRTASSLGLYQPTGCKRRREAGLVPDLSGVHGGTCITSPSTPFPTMKYLVCLPSNLDWERVGLCLGIPDDCITTIKKDNPNNSVGCQRAMFRKWLKLKSQSATYQSLIDVLKEMEDNEAVRIVEEQILKHVKSEGHLVANQTSPDPNMLGSSRAIPENDLHQYHSHDELEHDGRRTSHTRLLEFSTAEDDTEGKAATFPADENMDHKDSEIPTAYLGDEQHNEILTSPDNSFGGVEMAYNDASLNTESYRPAQQESDDSPHLQQLNPNSEVAEQERDRESDMDDPKANPLVLQVVVPPGTQSSAVPDLPTFQLACSNSENAVTNSQKYDLTMHCRGYQSNLADPGIKGDNYIICLPTGSGKTFVASIIIANHLKHNAVEKCKKRKVLFVVPTRQLAHQQQKRDSEEFIHSVLPAVDAVVCTPGKLRHELYLKKVQMSDFSLVILDECHHAAQPTSIYGDTMELYLMEKNSTNGVQMPQVIGLTASLGAGRTKSPTLEKVLQHQKTLCARVNAINGVKTDHSEEVQKHSTNPKCIKEILERRKSSDPFIQAVSKSMGKLERLLGVRSPKWQHTDYRYKQWIEKEISAAELRDVDQRNVLSILEHLLQYHMAIVTYEDFEFKDAIKFIEGVGTLPVCQMTESLKQITQELCHQLTGLEKIKNPILSQIEKMLSVQFKSIPQSKGIFFVREIKHTQMMSRWLNSSTELRDLIKSSPITGHSRAGMSSGEQERVLQSFRDGRYNMLVATSVLHEGIDVPDCNLVIHFQYLPNEIAEMQAQGRARAKDSKIYTFIATSSPGDCRALIKTLKEELSIKALENIANRDITSEIHPLQQQIIKKRKQRQQEAIRNKSKWNPSEVELLCLWCKAPVCTGVDVFKYSEPHTAHNYHYVFPDADLDESQKKPCESTDTRYGAIKVFDVECYRHHCHNKLGNISQWKDGLNSTTLFVLKCNAFTFRHKVRETDTFKQWKRVPFEVRRYDDSIDDGDIIIEPLDVLAPSS